MSTRKEDNKTISIDIQYDFYIEISFEVHWTNNKLNKKISV
jgi:hypothetical protein